MEIRARVVRQEKGIYIINYDGKDNFAEISGKLRYDAKTISDYPAVGDYVVATWPDDGSHSIINNIFPRKSMFTRKVAGNTYEEQVVATNIDTVFICTSINQDLNLRRLERYIVVSWDSGATPVIVLTKADLCDDIASVISQVELISNGADIVITSAKNNEIDKILRYLNPGQTCAFIGSSGVGKSTLINALTGSDILKTADIREDDDKGRHTTTHRQLIELKNGAYVIDTPGMRELGLCNNEAGIENVFEDVELLISKCKFTNCSHTNEPGCKIQEALNSGELTNERWNSYKKLITENSYNSNENEYLKAKNEKFKGIALANKKRNKYK